MKREVHELVALFGKFNGGYIGSTSHAVMPETPLDNVIAILLSGPRGIVSTLKTPGP